MPTRGALGAGSVSYREKRSGGEGLTRVVGGPRELVVGRAVT